MGKSCFDVEAIEESVGCWNGTNNCRFWLCFRSTWLAADDWRWPLKKEFAVSSAPSYCHKGNGFVFFHVFPLFFWLDLPVGVFSFNNIFFAHLFPWILVQLWQWGCWQEHCRYVFWSQKWRARGPHMLIILLILFGVIVLFGSIWRVLVPNFNPDQCTLTLKMRCRLVDCP